MKLEVIVLAAGKGTRMYSDEPKVLHRLAGRSMLAHVLGTARLLQPERIHVVVGYQGERIRSAFADEPDLNWVTQESQLGTGHAVQQAMPGVDTGNAVLVLYGDVPLTSVATLQSLMNCLDRSALAILTLETDAPEGLGRIVRDVRGQLAAIVEEKDATPDQRRITEINSGILAAHGKRLKEWIESLDNDNAQGEYYLTDVVALAHRAGDHLEGLVTRDPIEVQGVNNRVQLAMLERRWQSMLAETLMLRGVTFADPARVDIRGSFSPGRDNRIDINAVLEGDVRTGDRVQIGPNAFIRDCEIGDDVVILPNCHLEGVRIHAGCHIGPFARLREGTVLDERSRIGNFVETKKSFIGEDSKVNHLSYIGDTDMGRSVNIGAGTITCNYDGEEKHRTRIEDGSFVGSNTALVAPVTLGHRSIIGAGSVITEKVPADNLAVGRARQRNISDWKRRRNRESDGS